MKAYLNKCEAVIDLHERGFTEDFKLFGNHLLWIQQKIYLPPKEFSIIERHRFRNDSEEVFIYTVTSNCYAAKGILINHDKNFTRETAEAIQNNPIERHLIANNFHYEYAG